MWAFWLVIALVSNILAIVLQKRNKRLSAIGAVIAFYSWIMFIYSSISSS